MSIKLTLPQLPDTTFIIHRGTERDKLVELTQVEPGVSEYVDTDIEPRTLYYYRVDARSPDDYAYGVIKTHSWVQERGIGPQEIVLGDWELGFFGTVNAEDIWGTTQPLYFTSIGLTKSVLGSIEKFHKLAWEGKVIFVPDRPFGYVNGVFKDLMQDFYMNRLLYPVGFPDAYRDPILTGQSYPQGDHTTINGYDYIVSNIGVGNPLRTPSNSGMQMAVGGYQTNSLWQQVKRIYGQTTQHTPTNPGERGLLDCIPSTIFPVSVPSNNHYLLRWDASSFKDLRVGTINQAVPNAVAPETALNYEFLGYLELKG